MKAQAQLQQGNIQTPSLPSQGLLRLKQGPG